MEKLNSFISLIKSNKPIRVVGCSFISIFCVCCILFIIFFSYEETAPIPTPPPTNTSTQIPLILDTLPTTQTPLPPTDTMLSSDSTQIVEALLTQAAEAQTAAASPFMVTPTDTIIFPTDTPIPPPPTISENVVIEFINYDGDVPYVESDEYAKITNKGTTPVNLKGWRLNAGDPGQDFYFPDYTLNPGESCRVYTNEIHDETCGFSFRSGKAIWNNKGDCGYLYDDKGEPVDEKCY